ncbi:MAG: hypothetical protein ACRYGG_03205, partial [Janthinobacterium lividum]
TDVCHVADATRFLKYSGAWAAQSNLGDARVLQVLIAEAFKDPRWTHFALRRCGKDGEYVNRYAQPVSTIAMAGLYRRGNILQMRRMLAVQNMGNMVQTPVKVFEAFTNEHKQSLLATPPVQQQKQDVDEPLDGDMSGLFLG